MAGIWKQDFTLLTLISGISIAIDGDLSRPIMPPVTVMMYNVPSARNFDSITITLIHGGCWSHISEEIKFISYNNNNLTHWLPQ